LCIIWTEGLGYLVADVLDQNFVWIAKRPSLTGADDKRYGGKNELLWRRSDDCGGEEGCLIDPIDIGAALIFNAMTAMCLPVQLLYARSRPGFKSVSTKPDIRRRILMRTEQPL
jgi:hypothetical protein